MTTAHCKRSWVLIKTMTVHLTSLRGQRWSWFQLGLALVVIWSVIDRWPTLRALYSDDGVLPVAAWHASIARPAEASLLQLLCVHAWFGEIWWPRLLSIVQVGLSCVLPARWAAFGSLWLYASATVRAISSSYILDRYLLLELALACFGDEGQTTGLLWRLQLVWIYADAGWGKAMDEGWSTNAKVPALDAYTRHTMAARIARAFFGRQGLRLLTPFVPLIELVLPPLAVLGYPIAAVPVCALHLGIAFCMNGAMLLSFAAIVAWLPFIPNKTVSRGRSSLSSGVLIAIALACIYSAASGRSQCLDAAASPLSALVHNRWNVFSGVDTTVTWEIMPARLNDGQVVDLWAYGADVEWSVPQRAPRWGRWRTFPMLGAPNVPKDVLDQTYAYFCREWNDKANLPQSKRLSHFHVYMLMADDNDAAGSISKRLLHVMQCY